MKDSLITAKQKKTEITILLICFLISNLVNLYAIIFYETKYSELFTQLGYVCLFTIALYLFLNVFRIVFKLIRKTI